jgi:hypothetical protein
MTAIFEKDLEGQDEVPFPYSKGCERTSRRLFGKNHFSGVCG